METIYLCIVIFLLCLAVFDLFVGVSNDAVNFLQSAVGARVASFRTILIIASVGVMLGAVMSSGMMDVARHGIMMPAHYSFHEVMTIMLAVMVTDIIVLDAFNTLGMPTSTTVSLVFELLGGTAMLALLKVMGDPTLEYADLINSDKALQVIIAIFVSVAISFVIGMVVMWLSRIVFTFHYSKHSRYSIAIFGGIAFTALSYFIFMKGMGKSPYLPENVRDYIEEHTNWLLLCTFLVSTVAMQLLHLLRVNIFKFTVLMGTFGLAMAFAGNDLVNFIGVPLAGLDSYQDFTAHAHGETIDTFMMSSLMESATTPPLYLILAGLVMIFAMATSKKAQHVIQTSVDLSRQDEGDEMFGSSKVARSLVRFSNSVAGAVLRYTPMKVRRYVDSRFQIPEDYDDNGAAYDMCRASVNLCVASLLIALGTSLKLPLSTTFVTFMVAMGSSLADRAWSRESAVFRITGVLTVIGGWFITAGVAFTACFAVAMAMRFGGVVAVVVIVVAGLYSIIHSQQRFAKKEREVNEGEDVLFQQMITAKDRSTIAKVDGEECIMLSVNKQSGSNTVKVAQSAVDRLNEVIAENDALQADVVMDQSDYINMTVDNAVQNIWMGVLFAAVVLLVFLRDLGATLSLTIAMPCCILFTFLIMNVCGITLNMMSLGGITLGVGMIVDNSIVVLENIFSYRADGYSRWDACTKGTGEVMTSVTASTLTTIAVFLPIALSGGMTGMMFREFCITIVALLLSSLVIALTLVPLLCYFLLDESKVHLDALQRAQKGGRRAQKLMGWYVKKLDYYIHHLKRGVLVSVALVAVFLAACLNTKMVLLPEMDEGMVTVTVSMPIGSKVEQAAAMAERAGRWQCRSRCGRARPCR